MDMIVPKYNTYRMVVAQPDMLRTMLQDFFLPILRERELDESPRPIDYNRFAHSIGFPSYAKFKQFLKCGDCPDESRDLLEYGRSIIESDHVEGGLVGRYNAQIVKHVMNSVHDMTEKVDHTSSDGTMSPAQAVLPPEITSMLDYLHDGHIA